MIASRILLLDHRGRSVPELVSYLERRVSLERLRPEEVKRRGSSLASEFDGVVASGGYLPSAAYRGALAWYQELLSGSDRPFLGICLGMKILGCCYGARLRRIEPVVGVRPLRFESDYPLAPGIRTMEVYENHGYELIPPLINPLTNYASGSSPVEAVRVEDRDQFAVQFHPELGGAQTIILDSFIDVCLK